MDMEHFADDFGHVPGQAGSGGPSGTDEKQGPLAGATQESRVAEAERLYNCWLASVAVDDYTKEELRSLAGIEVEIEDRFGGELSFGTGGMRGVMGAGTRRMNIYVVRRATQGFADYLNTRFGTIAQKKVAIAYDSRRFSPEFALEAALVLAANGIKALLFREMRPTPQLSFTIRELGCQGGIIITASHNPPEYNGFKVYGEDGGQIVPDRAAEITAAINKVDYFKDVKLISSEEAVGKDLLAYLGEEIDRRYLDRIKTLSQHPGDEKMGIVYTSLHGTGIFLVPRLLQEMGYKNVHVVPAQADPDPAFPTLRVPNPEDRDSFALALELASAKNAELILATDPDADRVGCAVHDGKGGYNLLNGNQVGALLIAYLLEHLHKKNALPPNGVIVKTIVTGNLGREIAASYGIPTVETLTGFKFIGEKIGEFEEKQDRRFIFGYEESYGYLAGTFVRDKDAIIASALIAEMTAYHRQKGKNLLEVLEELYRRYGYYREELVSLALADLQLAEKLLRTFSDAALQEFSGIKIEEKRDYRLGKAWDPQSKKEHNLSLPVSDVIFFTLVDGSWFCIRPSGTEPKIKFYFAVQADSAAAAEAKMNALKEDVLARARLE
ncbi:MAG: phospho-sugar mutase [Bacillota bacterium]